MADSENGIKKDRTFGELDPDIKILIEQVRMAKRRSEVPCPDIDLAWAHLDSNLSVDKSRLGGHRQRQRNDWRMWGAALLGAAAMLALVFVYSRFFSPEEAVSTMVLAYDDSPQYITLQGETSALTNLTHKDSISYYTARKPEVTAAVAAGTSGEAVAPVMQRLATPRGMDFKIILPDGSEVWLNAASNIEFPSAFTEGERRVVLRGEAYFKVARDEENPFIVSSEHMDVRVLGTEFNMSTYNAEQPYVSLVKGAVEVLNEQTNEPALVLHPGEEVRRMQDGQLRVRKIDTYAVTRWVEGFFYFDNQPLIDVLRELGRWYNMGVIFRHPSMLKKKIHFSASRHESIEHALDDISRLLNVEISIEDCNIVIQ